MLTVIDNYDSFTFNLVQAFGSLGEEIRVYRNDEKPVEEIIAEEPDGIIISPGPSTPQNAGISLPLVLALARRAERSRHPAEVIPLFGVCLGHQTLAAAYGAKIVRAGEIVHGKVSRVYHSGEGLFKSLAPEFIAARYHSLVVDPFSLNPELKVTARTENGIIMALEHRRFPFFGVQFHPESVLTPDGTKILSAFLEVVERYRAWRSSRRGMTDRYNAQEDENARSI